MLCCPVHALEYACCSDQLNTDSGSTDSTGQSRRCSTETVVIDIKFDVMHDNSISFDLACFYVCVFILRIMNTEL